MDFDERYERYIRKWLQDNAENYSDYDSLELAAAQMYDVWADEVDLDAGVSPRKYFEGLSDDALADYLSLAIGKSAKLPQIALDEFYRREFSMSLILPVLCKMRSDELTLLYIIAARKRETKQIIDIYSDYLTRSDADPSILEEIFESLCENVSLCCDKLLAFIPQAGEKQREYVCDILAHAYADERVFRALTVGLFEYNNVMLYASLLARFGDDRAIQYLNEIAKICDYAGFLEVRNAVISLGGEVLAERDFSQDETYKRIKADNITKDKL